MAELSNFTHTGNMKMNIIFQDPGNIEDCGCSVDKIFHARYGHNILPLPPCISIPKVSITKLKS